MSRSLRNLCVLAVVAAVSPVRAQVPEHEQPMDLTAGLVAHAEAASAGEAIGDPTQTQVAQQSFAVSALVEFARRSSDTVLFGQGDDRQGWRLLVTQDGALRFEARPPGRAGVITVSTAPGVIAPGTRHHVAANIQRDAAKPAAGLWLDGVELASGAVPPADFGATLPFRTGVAAQHVRLYHRPLSRPEVLGLTLEAMEKQEKPMAKHPDPPTSGPRFIPQPGVTIALIGGTEAVALAESGELEALLLLAFPQTRFHFRSLAWEGDTVFKQDRPLGFGDLEQQLRRVKAGAVFVMFGRQECLESGWRQAQGGSDGLAEFKDAFGRLLDTVAKVTPDVVVIGPWGYERKPPPAPNLEAAEAARVALTAVLEASSTARSCRFLDLLEHNIPPSAPMTTDGVNLTPYGLQLMAQSIMLALASPLADTQGAAFDRLKQSVQTKNRLWHDYWRPSNWAFLHGDRTQQPSSRDPVNPQVRFFPAEQERYLPLLKNAEERVFKLVEEAAKQLP